MAKSNKTGKSVSKPAAKQVKKQTKPASHAPTKTTAEKVPVDPKAAGTPSGIKAIVDDAKARAAAAKAKAADAKAKQVAKPTAPKAAKPKAQKAPEESQSDVSLPTELDIFNVVHKQWDENSQAWIKKFDLPEDLDDAKTVLFQKVRYGKIKLSELN